jgi:Htaa
MPSLRWGVKDSLRTYVIGVGGTIEVAAPAAVAGACYRFPGQLPATGAAAGSVLMFCGTVSVSPG